MSKQAINYTQKIASIQPITRKEFLSDRNKSKRSGSTWTIKTEDNALYVYISVHGYGRKILASYRCVFGGVTDICFGGYLEAAQKEANSIYYNKA